MIKPTTPPLFVVVHDGKYLQGFKPKTKLAVWVDDPNGAARMPEASAHRCASKLAAKVPGQYAVRAL